MPTFFHQDEVKTYFVPGRIFEFGGFSHDMNFLLKRGIKPRDYLYNEGTKKRYCPKKWGHYLLIWYGTSTRKTRNGHKFTSHVIKFLTPEGSVVVDHFTRFSMRIVDRWNVVSQIEEEEFLKVMEPLTDIFIKPGKLYRWRIDEVETYGQRQWSASMVRNTSTKGLVRHWPEPSDVYLCTSIKRVFEDDERSYDKGYYWVVSFLSPDGFIVEDHIHRIEHAFLRWESV